MSPGPLSHHTQPTGFTVGAGPCPAGHLGLVWHCGRLPGHLPDFCHAQPGFLSHPRAQPGADGAAARSQGAAGGGAVRKGDRSGCWAVFCGEAARPHALRCDPQTRESPERLRPQAARRSAGRRGCPGDTQGSVCPSVPGRVCRAGQPRAGACGREQRPRPGGWAQLAAGQQGSGSPDKPALFSGLRGTSWGGLLSKPPGRWGGQGQSPSPARLPQRG